MSTPSLTEPTPDTANDKNAQAQRCSTCGGRRSEWEKCECDRKQAYTLTDWLFIAWTLILLYGGIAIGAIVALR